ncbi:carboxypeptidase-like regulatory domain-containing protein [Flavobacteriaceae bacterium GSB9]|nr:carboxypeptidase-like regulatory domain-containing protein [Flavobacteriaceae bacterium GSB9]
MKRIFFLFMVLLFSSTSNAQNNDLWLKVETLEAEGLPKSALKVVEDIQQKAIKGNNSVQLVKTMLFKGKFALVLEEDAQLNIVDDFRNQIEKSAFPTKNILENMLANMFWQYFNQNRWQFYNRTKTSEKVNKNDFRTWDLETLFNEVHLHFQNSLQNGLMLQQEKLNQYSVLLQEVKGSKKFRPTLYDFLSHQALEFYTTNETHITKPAYKFELDNPEFLADARRFSELRITSKDSTALQLNALKIYQDLIQFHLKGKSAYPLADVDIERLKFVYEHGIFNNNEALLLEALKAQSEQLSGHETSGLYDFEIASLYFQLSQNFQPSANEIHRWKAKEALEICNGVISKFPKSTAAEKCKTLKSQIEYQSLQITAEAFLPIQAHSRLLVRYKNLDELHFKILKLSEKEFEAFKKIYRKDEQLPFLNTLDVTDTWKSPLKNEEDYQVHSSEIVVPKLNNGRYVVLATVEGAENVFGFAHIQVTDLALVETETPQHKVFQIINRNNGAPISNAEIVLSFYKNNNRTTQSKTYNTNGVGQIEIAKSQVRYSHILAKVKYGKDTAYFGNYYISPYYDRNEEKETYKAFVFTDRSIYRPGQTVYFKAIAMKTIDGNSEVAANELVYATLYNVNDEEVAELEFKTNAFGSVAGEFILPNNGLNGQYYIEFDGDEEDFFTEHYISVEEYKRPKFKTEFQPITKNYKVNDSITVKGTALAYAGSHITEAKVVYRVHRKVQYPRWYYWYRPWFNSEPQEILHGETLTDEKGDFTITFKALPDQSIDKSNLPIFHYEITADVTDLNGETRSTTSIVNVGYHALVATMDVPKILDKTNKEHTINIETKNLNGEFVSAKGTIEIYKLKAPNAVLRKRPWAAPDYQTLSKEAFKKMFPHEAYTNEHESENWEKDKLMLTKTFDTKFSKEVELGKIKKWVSGQYLVLLKSKDRFGQTVTDQAKISVFSESDKVLADNQLFSISSDKASYHAGEMAEITLASATEDLSVTVSVEKDGDIIKTEVITLNANKKSIQIPVNQNDLGGFAVHYSFAVFNSFQSGTLNMSVPYPKTDLDIETLTFRDKLQPGTDETWQFKIKGPLGEKVSAELLASMYDASLDQFKSHSWNFSPLYQPTYNPHVYSQHSKSFGTQNFRVYNGKMRIRYPQQDYDQWNWFGFSFNFNKWYYDNYIRTLRLKTVSRYDDSIKNGFVSGLVIDEEGNPLPGVNVLVKGTTRGTTTDFDGKFSIKASKTETLVLSFIGFVSRSVNINDDNFLKLSMAEDSAQLNEVVVAGYGARKKSDITGAVSTIQAAPLKEEMNMELKEDVIEENNDKRNFDNIQIRKNLQETAFFFPQLQTDADGNISFSFTTPEALTQWKLQLLAHTKTLESTVTQLETVTQKELMVIPNAPRFLREGDKITISTKIANLTEKKVSGEAKLILTDAISGEEINEMLVTSSAVETFSVLPSGNTQVSWNLTIPENVNAVQYKIAAQAGDFSDGEQSALPVLSNRMLVTETMPMWVKSNETQTFTLDKLQTNTSSTLKNHKLTLEITSNPAWYAVQALPYLMEYPYQCNEQTFSRYYANALASHIVNSNPRIQEVFNQWASQAALISNLEKNQELKSILIQETPWLRDAQSETDQKKRIALLFDLNKMNNELEMAMRKLKNNQMSSGAWAWFNGGYENRYVTQHIITGFGHLLKLNVIQGDTAKKMLEKAINYLDSEFIKEYKDIRKYNPTVDLNEDHLSYTQFHYLYMRSFFPEIKRSNEVEEFMAYYQSQIQKYWLSRSLYAKGLMALVSHRNGDEKTASKILKSLKETSITSEELGMYWKTNTNSWFWYQAPIETQALLIEAFSEIENDIETIDNLKIWLLKNKQTNRWKTTKATTDAVYALLLQGSDWLSVTDAVDVVVGNEKIETAKLENVNIEAGTGYFKTSWNASEIKPEMAKVTISKKGNGIAWGGLYWQYFEDLDKITSAETPLKLKKQLFLKKNTDTGEQISEITKNSPLKVGDLVRVRIELRSDRAMEFVHMKDMRAAGLEPVNVLSAYKWQDGLGYYESTKDASTNFFFDYLPKGIYVFEYDLRVNNAGEMSNGITTTQSMYAPEFSSHSEGTKIYVE